MWVDLAEELSALWYPDMWGALISGWVRRSLGRGTPPGRKPVVRVRGTRAKDRREYNAARETAVRADPVKWELRKAQRRASQQRRKGVT